MTPSTDHPGLAPPDRPEDQPLGRWVRDHADDLRRFLAKRRIIESDIKDVCQEVYLRILRFDRSEVIQNPAAYLYRVAANVAHDLKLRQAQWTPLSIDAHELGEAPPSDHEVEAASRQRALYDALDKLPPLMRAALLLQVKEDLTYEAIAERLGVSHRVIKRTILRAHALVRETLAPDI